jgi:ABC-type Na+ efflux pump permease subunit
MTVKNIENANEQRHRAFSVGRVVAITNNTLTELTRQKVFYVILIFGLLLIGTSGFMAQLSFQQEFQVLKDVSLGAMSIFTSLLAIVTTARLLPEEIEQRTIYTILAKPVARIEYLLGKLMGVLLLLVISITLMSVLFVAVLYAREQSVLHESARQISRFPAAQINETTQRIHASAFSANLLPAIAIILLKGCLLASLTLLVSTFASTNIFTVVVMVFIYFIGHLQATARHYWLEEKSVSWLTRIFLAFVALIFPDLQAFNLVDDVIAGALIPLQLFLHTVFLGTFYTATYLLLAAIVFYGKEL